ncbi:glutaredoxin family protein [Brachybacterium sacelli]|uniref:Glutaredoxin domain-containing protein n=1 Tax=Brachybacterium sacelli TaxID=173364 RepID=A0ABS4WVU8_9MICO|nr:hypothetical protein [Brachybacterium sacelli]MBP2380327.1 hypothetical protein [Brachybacterium sacelli]
MHRGTLPTLVVGTLAVAALALVLGADDHRDGVIVGVVGELGVIAVALWSGRRGRHTPWPRAMAALAPGRALVLWKPGCLYCERLMLQLRKDPRVIWVNVWRDEEAKARVREVNGGDELTPTALIGEDVLRNPTAQELRERLSRVR